MTLGMSVRDEYVLSLSHVFRPTMANHMAFVDEPRVASQYNIRPAHSSSPRITADSGTGLSATYVPLSRHSIRLTDGAVSSILVLGPHTGLHSVGVVHLQRAPLDDRAACQSKLHDLR